LKIQIAAKHDETPQEDYAACDAKVASGRADVRSALLLYRRGQCAYCDWLLGGGRRKHGGGSVMELRTASPRKYDHTRPVNLCAQCGETIFLPEWSEYLDRHRVRHLWECEACGYKFETLVSFPES
jgi:DNA-directed RNA polymerase subunit RPC12/RpoP